jgi:hypothetical protein
MRDRSFTGTSSAHCCRWHNFHSLPDSPGLPKLSQLREFLFAWYNLSHPRYSACEHSMTLNILPVVTRCDLKRFVTFRWRIYRGDPNWVSPLIDGQMDKLPPGRNLFREHAERATRWMMGPLPPLLPGDIRAVGAALSPHPPSARGDPSAVGGTSKRGREG